MTVEKLLEKLNKCKEEGYSNSEVFSVYDGDCLSGSDRVIVQEFNDGIVVLLIEEDYVKSYSGRTKVIF